MFTIFLLMILTTINMVIFFNSHPIIKGFSVILQVPIHSMMSMIILNTSWFSFILFLTFIGGILILFIYSISLLENEVMIKMNLKLNYLIICLLTILLFTMSKMETLNGISYSLTENFYFSTKMKLNFIFFFFSKSYWKMTSFFILYLLLSMISMLKIINMQKKNY